jgi:hypothetical protein
MPRSAGARPEVLTLNLISAWRESGWADVVQCHDSRVLAGCRKVLG